MPYLLGHKTRLQDRTLFCYANRMGAARMGKWEFLVEYNVHYLFDLENDIGETSNVMNQNCDVMQSKASKYDYRNVKCSTPSVRHLPIIFVLI